MVVSILLKIKFGHTQISVPKIGIPMSKTGCINPSYIYIYINWLEVTHDRQSALIEQK